MESAIAGGAKRDSCTPAGLECLLDIIRVLRMGSCLSTDAIGSQSPSSKKPTRSSSSSSRRRRRSRNNNNNESRRVEEHLHRIPGRMFLNGSTTAASLFTQQGRKGINQDAMIVWENFGSRTDTVFCGVFDGHGPFGHLVSRRVRDSLPLKLNTQWGDANNGNNTNLATTQNNNNSICTTGSMTSDETQPVCLLDDQPGGISVNYQERQHPEIFTTVMKESFLKAFRVMDKELKLHPHIDCFCSGTTAVTLLKQGQDLIIGNVGDSRAILGTRDHNDCLIPIQLTEDLKPNLPREAERIKRCKGRVFALQDEPEVSRVWLPHCDSPGLAMARAFGDFCLKDFGLISVPDITYRRLTERDKFIVLASDGIWDVLSNKEVVDIVASTPARSSAARSLVDSAVKAWKYRYPTSKIDDCAVVCLFLDSDAPESLDATETCINKQDESSRSVNLDQCGTACSCSEIHPDGCEEEGDTWSALEGVSRVDTLVTLPRFVSEGKRPAGSRAPK